MPDPRQKKRAKQKKKRAKAGRAGVRYVSPTAEMEVDKQLANKVEQLPPGPCFITRGWQVPSQPRLQCIVATRLMSDELVMPAAILVDLGCQGVRDAYFAKPIKPGDMDALLGVFRDLFPRGFEEIPARRAATIVHQAVAYAAEIGLEVPAKAKAALRTLPDELEEGLEVEMGRRGKPLYAPQPDEDTKPMVKRLVEAVGPDGFEVELPKKRVSEGEQKG